MSTWQEALAARRQRRRLVPSWVYRWSDWKHWRWQCRRVIGFVQRGRRGWAIQDTWSTDHYIASVLAGMLREMAEQPCGHPWCGLQHDGPDAVPCERETGCFESEEAWAAWLRDKADWFQWYADDEMGWGGKPDGEARRMIDAYNAKHKEFRDVILVDFTKHFGTLWT